MDPEERKKLRERMMSGILGFGKNVYQGNPALRAVGDPIRDVYRNYDFEMQEGLPQVVMSKQNPLTIDITRRLEPRYRGPQYGRGGAPTQKELERQMIINRNRAGLLNLRNQNAVPDAAISGNMAQREEEEDNPYDRQFFGELIANAYAASLGGKPPTPYAQGVGTLRNFTALPFA
tara:strand:+ start:525 stop:1052 length:528 start_codon:yes stop_codon:yes gene_type:complete